MNKGYFISATNTERGKTVFTAGFTLWLRENGINALPMKPIQSGVKEAEIAPDLEYNFRLTGINPSDEELELMQPYCFFDPCAPHLAAERERCSYPSIDYIKDCAIQLLKKYELILAEGAGGLLVPFDREKKLYIIDLIKALDFEVILVTQNKLGTINDTCLSIEALQRRDIKIAGFVFNDCDKEYKGDYISLDNPKVITEFTGIKFLGRISYMKNINKPSLLNIFNNMHELQKLLKRNKNG